MPKQDETCKDFVRGNARSEGRAGVAGTVSRGKAVLCGEEERGQERGQESRVGAVQGSLGQALGKLQASGPSGTLKPGPPCGVREAAPSPPLRWISEPKEGGRPWPVTLPLLGPACRMRKFTDKGPGFPTVQGDESPSDLHSELKRKR